MIRFAMMGCFIAVSGQGELPENDMEHGRIGGGPEGPPRCEPEGRRSDGLVLGEHSPDPEHDDGAHDGP
ncbi:MAG: hypothetical protein ACRCVZ_06790, partial [Aestuariivirga sp.]